MSSKKGAGEKKKEKRVSSKARTLGHMGLDPIPLTSRSLWVTWEKFFMLPEPRFPRL